MADKTDKRDQLKPKDYYEPVYTIGVAAAKLGISVYSFRQYEDEGLIIPHKTPTGRRLYSDLELEKIKCIKDMIQKEGLNFAGIRRMLAMIPCWKVRKCPSGKKRNCLAFRDSKRPCWSTTSKCEHPMPSCRDCPVYRKVVHCDEVLNLIFAPE